VLINPTAVVAAEKHERRAGTTGRRVAVTHVQPAKPYAYAYTYDERRSTRSAPSLGGVPT